MEGMQKDASKGHALFISETACIGGLKKEAGDARCRSSESNMSATPERSSQYHAPRKDCRIPA